MADGICADVGVVAVIIDKLKTYAFTAFFMSWEFSKRIKGAWRRREWHTLGRYALRMGAVLIVVLALGALATPARASGFYTPGWFDAALWLLFTPSGWLTLLMIVGGATALLVGLVKKRRG